MSEILLIGVRGYYRSASRPPAFVTLWRELVELKPSLYLIMYHGGPLDGAARESFSPDHNDYFQSQWQSLWSMRDCTVLIDIETDMGDFGEQYRPENKEWLAFCEAYLSEVPVLWWDSVIGFRLREDAALFMLSSWYHPDVMSIRRGE